MDDAEFEASLEELRQLAKTLGYEVVARFTQKRAGFDKTAYFGTGKREELRLLREEQGAELILIDHEISPSQAFNLAKEVGGEVMDRTMVILEIFHRHASSRFARAQVEIARLGYMGPRLREAAKQAGPKDRARSGTGGRSGGESHGELDRRKIRDRMAELQEDLDAMVLERKTQRARRGERQGLARVALVGYTNAGKSTLMRALTGSEVLVANKLFATLDTTVRALHPETVPRVLVSDTVGFIKNLPHGLVASFKSTLDEALEASLLAHVVDASDPGFERQLAVTEEVLDEIGAKDVPRLLVFNKIDKGGEREGACARSILRVRGDQRAPPGGHREAARGDRGVLPEAPGRGGAVPALVGAEQARRDLRQLQGAGGARRRRGRLPAHPRRARGRAAPAKAVRRARADPPQARVALAATPPLYNSRPFRNFSQ